ncbi:MAG: hypothetical protein WBL63_01350 [Candidatus Acidiferrum sp.]
MFLQIAAVPPMDWKRTQIPAFSSTRVHLLALLLLALPLFAGASPRTQENEKEALGSLTSFGDVYVNDSLAPAETTIFSGDRVRLGESGLATFTMSGKGSLKLAPHSEVLFTGKYEYTAELQSGSVVLTSVSGEHMFILRIGNEVVVPSFKERTALAEIDKSSDGSFLVKCSNGGLGVLALQGTQGRFLQAGQSLDISAAGALAAIEKPGAPFLKSSSGPIKGRAPKIVSAYPRWAYLGAAGLAAGIAYALENSVGGGKPSVSPAVP